ncbi:MAG: thioredoxin domain-containing protein [Nitrospirae bacterium]|nr:thioredoxin domain-containing protein [Nitrospirota bacterium]
MNRLSNEKSPYLRHSAEQKIDWYPWSEKAFQRAKEEDKPVFLSTGAVWCHWCHVMAKECFENSEIVELLNENYICIKLDRDERPDIDRRFQQAAVAMGSGGGWPLSMFLTPDKKPFFGGTYFPPEDSQGSPGFKKILRTVMEFYKTKRGDVDQYTQKLTNYLKPDKLISGEIGISMVDIVINDMLSESDAQNGGFGTAPKFQMPGAMEFLINHYCIAEKKSIKTVITNTLNAMAKGGFHDQIGEGFHRYSTDEAWIIPHFEKMADDNAWLLRNYIDAYSVFGDACFRAVAEGIIRFIREVLSDPEGCFYASQDADVTPDDEGGYFTWTDEEFKSVLNSEEYEILPMHLFHERGAMRHDRSKKVLYIAMDIQIIAEKTGKDIKTVSEIVNAGKNKLLRKRKTRETPFIDKTFYTSINCMLITSYLKAFRVIRDNALREFALKSLERIVAMHFAGNELLHTYGVKAVLDDYIYLTEAFVNAYEVTSDSFYLNQADRLMELCTKRFWDENEGGFFDTDEEVLGIRLKGIEDIPHPSANSLGILLLLKLYHLTGKDEYLRHSEKALKIFASRAKGMGIHSGYYFCALDAYFHQLKLTIHSAPDSELAKTALSLFSPYTSIAYGDERGYVLPCVKTECYEPLTTTEEIRTFLMGRRG